MNHFRIRSRPRESVGEAAKAVARHQAEQLTLVRRRAQPAAVYITRMTLTAVFAYLLALQLPGGSTRSVLAPLTALLVVQATLFHTIRSAVQRVIGVTAGVLAAVAVAAYVPFSWWVLGLLIAGTVALGLMLRLREETLEVPISAMLIFSVDSHAAATSRITETLVGAAAGLAAGLIFAPLRVQPAKDAIGDLTRQMAALLGEMADGLAAEPDPRRAVEWLEQTRALRGEIQRLDEALGQAEESVRLNPRRLRYPDPAAGLRDGVDTLERAAIDLRVLARAVADSARLDSDDSPVKDPETRARLAAVISELAAGVGAYGQLIEAGRRPPASPSRRPTRSRSSWKSTWKRPSASRTGWRTCWPPTRPNVRTAGRCAGRSWLTWTACAASWSLGARRRRARRAGRRGCCAAGAGPGPGRGPDRRAPALPVVDGLDVVTVGIAQEHGVVAGMVLRPFAGGVQDLDPGRHGGRVHGVDRGPVGRAERNVQFPGLVPGGRAQPERGDAVRTGQADYEAIAVREAHHLAHPDRGKGPQVEAERRLDVARLQAQVI